MNLNANYKASGISVLSPVRNATTQGALRRKWLTAVVSMWSIVQVKVSTQRSRFERNFDPEKVVGHGVLKRGLF